MKKQHLYLLGGFLLGFFLVSAGRYWFENLRGIGPAVSEPPVDIAELLLEGEDPLETMGGFSLSVFAKDLPKARVLLFDKAGNLLVSQTREGKISWLRVQDGEVVNQKILLDGLNNPHGMTFDCEENQEKIDPEGCDLYIAEEGRIRKYVYNFFDGIAKNPVTIIDLPDGGGHRNHFTRTLKFGPDGRLYVAIGSSCNVCNEEDSRRAKIFSLNKDGSDWKEYASGLRNTVFFAWHPQSQDMWGTEMGRDELGDDLPPDEINIIEEGENYGWPLCYGKQVHDEKYDSDDYVSGYAPCEETVPSLVDLQAHVAPLGLAFIPPESGWPEHMWFDLLIAEHGSWNRSEPVGYAISRIPLDELGGFTVDGGANIVDGTFAVDPEMQTFINGWLTEDNKALGRPVDLVFHNGDLYISDDKAHVVYKVSYTSPPRYTDEVSDTVVDARAQDGCLITGCSGEICASEETMSACIFKESYTCYQDAICGRDSDGECAWMKTDALEACLDAAPQIDGGAAEAEGPSV